MIEDVVPHLCRYPRDDAFLDNVAVEVAYQTKRLAQFASVVVWGGNNENENMMDQFADGAFMPAGEPFNRDVGVGDFVALFVDTVRRVVVAIDGSRPFVDTSPSNGVYSSAPYVKRWGNSNDPRFG